MVMIKLYYKIFLALGFLIAFGCKDAFAQRYIDRNGSASFFSEAPLENIDAHTKEVISVLDVKTGALVASVVMQSFDFKKSLMKEHFNENYIESEKYPKSVFKGNIVNIGQLDLLQDGKHEVEVSGDITIHGVTRPLTLKTYILTKNNQLSTEVKFPIKIADFDIEIPKIVMYNVAEEVAVTLSFNYTPLK